jgi:hypothetical protein
MENGLRMGIWSGPVAFLIFGIGLIGFAHFLPPPAPSLSSQEIAEVYANNTLGIRLGGILIMLAAALFAPFFASITVFMTRMEGRWPIYAWTQAMTATIVVLCFFIGAMLFTITAFRPERPDDLTQIMNDFAWLLFVAPAPPAVIQTFAIGFAIIGDRSRILPRWTAFFSFWVAVLFVPGAMAILFKTGPFAWNGVLAFWVPAVLVGLWSNVIALQMLGAIKKGRWQAAEPTGAA